MSLPCEDLWGAVEKDNEEDVSTFKTAHSIRVNISVVMERMGQLLLSVKSQFDKRAGVSGAISLEATTGMCYIRFAAQVG